MSTDETGQGAAAAPEMAETSPAVPHRLIQLITPAGERVSHPEFDFWVKDVSDEQLCSLF